MTTRHHGSGTRPAVREHQRVEAEVQADCTSGGQTFRGVATDVSLGGAFIETEQRPQFGSEIRLDLHVGGKLGTLSCSGKVRWSNERGFGMQFGLLGARDTHALVQLVGALKGKRAENGPGPASTAAAEEASDRASGSD